MAERTGSNAGFVAADENVALRAGVAGSGVVVGTGQTGESAPHAYVVGVEVRTRETSQACGRLSVHAGLAATGVAAGRADVVAGQVETRKANAAASGVGGRADETGGVAGRRLVDSHRSLNKSNAVRSEGDLAEGSIFAYSAERLTRLAGVVYEVIPVVAEGASFHVALHALRSVGTQLASSVHENVVYSNAGRAYIVDAACATGSAGRHTAGVGYLVTGVAGLALALVGSRAGSAVRVVAQET